MADNLTWTRPGAWLCYRLYRLMPYRPRARRLLAVYLWLGARAYYHIERREGRSA